MKRHIGRMANTDQKIVVVFMQIPGKEDHSLVVSTDNLPPRWEQYLMQILESPEGQGDENLGSVLGRRLMPESTETLLQSLHSANLLVSVSVDNVIMYPAPNQPYPLRKILENLGRLVPQNNAETSKFNPYTSNQEADAKQDGLGVANGLLQEAEMLEAEARNKRERAYSFAPQLRSQYEKPTTSKAFSLNTEVVPEKSAPKKATKTTTTKAATTKAPRKTSATKA